MRIALFGPPGVGKGTQARRLVAQHGLSHISTGEIIRAAMGAETPVGLKAKEYYDAGRLIPDALVRKMAEDAIAEQGYDQFALDGYPRTLHQAVWLTDFLDHHGASLHVVLFFVLPEAVIVDRLSKRRMHRVTGENFHLDHKPPPPEIDPSLIIQRHDDRPAAIRKRLHVYEDETRPVENYYREKGLLVELDALGDFDTVAERIQHVLNAHTV